jgi:hypothetical protein
MGTKSCAVWYRHTKNESDKQQSYKKLQMQDDHQGQPHGMFSADECFGGRALNRGIELCAVVEQMSSLQHMFRVHGDTVQCSGLHLTIPCFSPCHLDATVYSTTTH